MTKNFLIVITLALGVSACGPDPTMPMYEQSASAKIPDIQEDNRVKVSRIGVFQDDLAYNSRRGVYVIVDSKTGKEFLGISGVGISELGSHNAGKSSISDER